MFGYVKPVQAELLVKHYDFYRATYCGICRSMKRHTGALSPAMLTYDSVLLALVRMVYLPDADIAARTGRCLAHPMKKRCMLCENPATVYTAHAFALLAYYKLLDDLHDEPLVTRSAMTAARPVAATARQAALRAGLSDLDALMADRLGAIRRLEEAGCDSVDEPAARFGELLGAVFSEGMTESAHLLTYTLGYHLGKFIYAADAAEDYDRDRRTGAYNPYVLRYGGQELTAENRAAIHCALLLEGRQIEGAVNLLPFGERRTLEALICNILYLGLPERIRFLLPQTAAGEQTADGSDKNKNEKEISE